ncbi:MAG TPA: hypothetical protein VGQ96_00425 [Candidatus Eremiobacteraceae bacterium]|nr:hypothetical protein [Candidatus Eremiobacteraceae bacterium]
MAKPHRAGRISKIRAVLKLITQLAVAATAVIQLLQSTHRVH